jgi:hypothetical protein
MKTAIITLRGLIVLIVVTLFLPTGILAQVEGGEEQTARFSKEELTQMLAPIALYPDSLTADILMASTYPLELVEAERWLRQQKDLKGEALNTALKDKPWDTSVKALCHFPDILFSMSEKLDQTRKLGDAFLAQEKEVMTTIQELRKKALAQGNLKSGKEQKVIVEEEIIRIEPSDPQVVYVPVYDPYYVYGPWWYPAYPPYYWYWPPAYVGGAYVTYAPPLYFGFGIFSWVWFDWFHYGIHVNHHHTHYYHRHHYPPRGSASTSWRHNPTHRRGVAYRDRTTSAMYGSRPRQPSSTRMETRGYPSRTVTGSGSRTVTGEGGRTYRTPGERRERSAPRETVEPRQSRERSVTPGAPESRERRDVQRQDRPGRMPESSSRRDTPFRGVGEGRFERRAVERGGASMRSMQSRPSGGSSRGGGMRPQGGNVGGGGGMRPQGGNVGGGGGRR